MNPYRTLVDLARAADDLDAIRAATLAHDCHDLGSRLAAKHHASVARRALRLAEGPPLQYIAAAFETNPYHTLVRSARRRGCPTAVAAAIFARDCHALGQVEQARYHADCARRALRGAHLGA